MSGKKANEAQPEKNNSTGSTAQDKSAEEKPIIPEQDTTNASEQQAIL
jgi:hypothetical protein